MPSADSNSTVMVAVDGSVASKDALRWAADYAQLSGARLQAVAAWEWPVSLGIAIPLPDDYDPLVDAKTALDRTVAEVLGSSTAVHTTTLVVEGAAAYALVQAAKDAKLLVVGSRGHGGFAGLLLGSVSEHCARYAACPVVIVRHQQAGHDAA